MGRISLSGYFAMMGTTGAVSLITPQLHDPLLG
jgi:hypothetical protein